MPWNSLILPLVAGYYVITRSYFFRFAQPRLDRQRLIFESILAAVTVTVVTYLIRIVVQNFFPETFYSLYDYLPIRTPFFGTSFFTIIVALVCSDGVNLFLNKEKYVKKAIKDVGNEFELLMESSLSEGLLLQFTLDSNKFYIAWVKELPIPSISNYSRIIPAISGFRNEDKKLVFTTHYLSLYSKYVKEGKLTNLNALKVDLIIDLNNIVSVSYFSYDMYKEFNDMEGSQPVSG